MKTIQKLGLLAVALLFTFNLSAQTTTGDIFIGGAFQFNSNGGNVSGNGTTQDFDKTTSFTIAPRAAYFISDVIAVGTSVGFTSSRTTEPNDDYISSNLISINPFARYYMALNEQINFYGSAGAGLGFGGSKDVAGATTTDTGDIFNFNVGIGAGVAFFPAERVNIDFGFNIITFNSDSNTDPNANFEVTNNSFRFGLNSLAPQIGINFFL